MRHKTEKLRLNRETLRLLAARHLAAVQGGGKPVAGHRTGDCYTNDCKVYDDTAPRSNAWTGDDPTAGC